MRTSVLNAALTTVLASAAISATADVFLPRRAFAASVSPADVAPPIAMQCTDGDGQSRLGTDVFPGTRFSVPMGLSVDAPASLTGWKLRGCDSFKMGFVNGDLPSKRVTVALASIAAVSPWKGDKVFEQDVRKVVAQSDTPAQHIKVVEFKTLTLDGRPCADVVRTGTIDVPLGQAHEIISLFTRERIRLCLLTEAPQPGTAAFAIFKEVTPEVSSTFEDAARQFIEGMVLPERPGTSSGRTN